MDSKNQMLIKNDNAGKVNNKYEKEDKVMD